MNKETHIAIAKRSYQLLPDVVREFLNASQDEISFWSVFPDSLDKDNLDYGYWMHSRKMKILKHGKKTKLVWKHGSLALAIGSSRWQFRTYYRTGRMQEAKATLLKLMHYLTDMCTLPHLVFKEADFLHSPFEMHMAKEIFKECAHIDVSYQELEQPRSVYDSAVERMERIHNEQKSVLIELYSKDGNINSQKPLKFSIIKECLQACVDFISHIYLENTKEDDYLESIRGEK